MSKELVLKNGEYWVNVNVAAQFCNVTVQTINNWRRSPNPPPFDSREKLYPVIELGEWARLEQIYRSGRGGSFPYKPDMRRFGKSARPALPGMPVEPETVFIDQKQRLTKLQADKVEMDLRENANDLIRADDVLSAIIGMNTRIKTRFLGVASMIAPSVAGENDAHAVQKIIDETIREILEELSTDWQNEEIEDDEI